MADFYDRALDETRTTPVDEAAQDLKWLMSTSRGRRVMHRFLATTGQLSTSFHPDAAIAAFNEGKRAVGLVWLTDIRRLCIEAEFEMYKEAQNT
jgi:hypothetical protein